jgi:hypothetical protein
MYYVAPSDSPSKPIKSRGWYPYTQLPLCRLMTGGRTRRDRTRKNTPSWKPSGHTISLKNIISRGRYMIHAMNTPFMFSVQYFIPSHVGKHKQKKYSIFRHSEGTDYTTDNLYFKSVCQIWNTIMHSAQRIVPPFCIWNGATHKMVPQTVSLPRVKATKPSRSKNNIPIKFNHLKHGGFYMFQQH